MGIFNPGPPFKGVKHNKLFGWVYYENQNIPGKIDFRQTFNTKEEADTFAAKRPAIIPLG